MTTPDNKNKWNDRLKTADHTLVNELLNNFGLSGSLSLKDLPYAGLAGVGAMAISPKIRELKERRRQNKEVDDNQNVKDFSDDMSKMRGIIDQRKPDKAPARNHPSVPGFTPGSDTQSPYGIFDYNENGYIDGPAPGSNIRDISEHPRFNSADQGKSQRGRPFDREEE